MWGGAAEGMLSDQRSESLLNRGRGSIRFSIRKRGLNSHSPLLPPSNRDKSTPPPEIGLGLTAFGFLFTTLGIMFFFDRGLLAMGNVSALARCLRLARRRSAAALARSLAPSRALSPSLPFSRPPKQQKTNSSSSSPA